MTVGFSTGVVHVRPQSHTPQKANANRFSLQFVPDDEKVLAGLLKSTLVVELAFERDDSAIPRKFRRLRQQREALSRSGLKAFALRSEQELDICLLTPYRLRPWVRLHDPDDPTRNLRTIRLIAAPIEGGKLVGADTRFEDYYGGVAVGELIIPYTNPDYALAEAVSGKAPSSALVYVEALEARGWNACGVHELGVDARYNAADGPFNALFCEVTRTLLPVRPGKRCDWSLAPDGARHLFEERLEGKLALWHRVLKISTGLELGDFIRAVIPKTKKHKNGKKKRRNAKEKKPHIYDGVSPEALLQAFPEVDMKVGVNLDEGADCYLFWVTVGDHTVWGVERLNNRYDVLLLRSKQLAEDVLSGEITRGSLNGERYADDVLLKHCHDPRKPHVVQKKLVRAVKDFFKL